MRSVSTLINAHQRALMIVSQKEVSQPRPPKLDPLPGIATTKDKVMAVYRRYPWIFEPMWPLTLLQMRDKLNRPKEEILKEAIRTIQIHDRPIFDQAMKLYPQTSLSFVDPLDEVIERIFDNTLEWELYFKSPLADRYFGGAQTRHVTSWRPIPSEVLSPQAKQQIQDLLNSIDELRGFIPEDAQHGIHFQRLARVIHPRKFGYNETKDSDRSSTLTFLPQNFYFSNEPESLPPDLRTYAQRTFRNIVSWLYYDVNLQNPDFDNMESFKKRWAQLQGRSWSGLRLGIHMINPLPLYEVLLRKSILEELPTLQKLRVISKEARPEKDRITSHRLVSIEDYDLSNGSLTRVTRW